MRSGTKLFCTNINLSLFTTYITLNPTLPMQINIVCYIYSPNSNVQELLGIKTQMLKMTVTPQKRWKQGRKLQKKNSWILVAILAVYLFPLTSITIKATVTGTSASCRDGSRKLVIQGWTSIWNQFAISTKEVYKELHPRCGKILDPPLVCELFTLLQHQIMNMTPTNNGCLIRNYSVIQFLSPGNVSLK